jgi:hypothetical protein
MDKKTLLDITRSEWIAYKWLDVTTLGDKERMFIRGYMRTPPEAKIAGEEWDILNKAYRSA